MKKILTILGLVPLLFLNQACAEKASDKLPSKAKFVQALDSGKKQTLVVYGTSLTKGTKADGYGPWVLALKSALDTRYPGLVEIINEAKGGTSSKWGLNNIDNVIRHKPDAVFIEFAMNDAVVRYNQPVEETRANVEGMIEKIKAGSPSTEIILQLTHQAAGERSPRAHQDEHQQVYRDLAKKYGLRLIDNTTPWKDFIAKNGIDAFKKHAPDGVHMRISGIKIVTLPNTLKALGLINN